jgi:drug/metabolite transporter (DMT)-like permease
VLLAAVLHATWNLCAKRAGGGLPFVWLVGACICAGYLPVLAVYWSQWHPTLPPGTIPWILGSGALKTSYALFLQRGYRTGDFSLVYPLARGTGPLLSTLAAILFLAERPSPLALGGGLVIIAAIFLMTGGAQLFHESRAHLRHALTYGVTSGVLIAAYTIWDRHGVAKLGVPPLLYDAGTAFTQLALLTPFAWQRRSEVAVEWCDKRQWAIAIAVLSPIAYVLVLTALQVAPVSHVAPAREVSIVIGAFLGAKYLKESDGRRRIWAATAMAAGVIALALG